MALKQLENFIPAVIISLQNLLLEKEEVHNNLYLLIKSLGHFSIILSDNHYNFEAETINSCTPKKAFFFMNPKNLGAFLMIENWHIEYRLKKNSHHLELSLLVEKAQISQNDFEIFIQKQNLPNIKIKIDLLSDESLFNSNKAFQDTVSKLKNQLIKQEMEQIAPQKTRNIEEFIPDLKPIVITSSFQRPKVRIFDYFGTPFLNEIDLRRGVDTVKTYDFYCNLITPTQIQHNQSLREKFLAVQKAASKKSKVSKSKKIRKMPKKNIEKLIETPKQQLNSFDLGTLIAWQTSKQSKK